MKIKIAYFAILVLSLVTLLSGCVNNIVNTEEKISLRFTYWGGLLEKEAVESMIATFNEQQPNIEVSGQLVPNNYLEKINTMAASKTLPDVGYFPETTLSPWIESGLIRDLTPFFTSDQTNEKLDYTLFQFNNGPIGGGSVSNGVYNIYYNKDLFEEANVPLPPTNKEEAWTWDEFVDIAKELTVDRNGFTANEPEFDPGNIETYGVNNLTLVIENFLFSNEGGYVDQEGKELLIDSEETIEVLQEVADLMNVHHVMPRPSDMSTIPSQDTALLTRRVAMTIDGQWALQMLGKAKVEEGLNLGIGVLPYFKEPVTTNYGTPIVAFETGKDQKHLEAVDTFLDFIMDPENVLLLINEGLWMPNEVAWYEEEEKIQKWIDTPIHPPEFKEAVIDWAKTNVVQNPNYFWDDRQEMQDIINPALDQLWLDHKSAEDIVQQDIMPRIKQQFGSKYE